MAHYPSIAGSLADKRQQHYVEVGFADFSVPPATLVYNPYLPANYDNVLAVPCDAWDATNATYTCPFTGVYMVFFTAAIGRTVAGVSESLHRLAFFVQRLSPTSTTLLSSELVRVASRRRVTYSALFSADKDDVIEFQEELRSWAADFRHKLYTAMFYVGPST